MRNRIFALTIALAVPMLGQPAGGGRGGPPQTPKAAAPVDLTGYWVSVVTEDWRFRMITPSKGDYTSVPLNAAGKKAADAWDPDKDTADGAQCKAYGAVGVMQRPGRLHVVWKDDNTLQMDTDSGTQTRLFHFVQSAASGEPTWQAALRQGQLPATTPTEALAMSAFAAAAKVAV